MSLKHIYSFTARPYCEQWQNKLTTTIVLQVKRDVHRIDKCGYSTFDLIYVKWSINKLLTVGYYYFLFYWNLFKGNYFSNNKQHNVCKKSLAIKTNCNSRNGLPWVTHPLFITVYDSSINFIPKLSFWPVCTCLG